jgi:hypothetical protein
VFDLHVLSVLQRPATLQQEDHQSVRAVNRALNGDLLQQLGSLFLNVRPLKREGFVLLTSAIGGGASDASDAAGFSDRSSFR